MNQQQKSYVMKRMNEIKSEKEEIIRKENSTEEKRLKAREKFNLIKNNMVEFNKEEDINFNYYSISMDDIYDFSSFEIKESFNREKYNEQINVLNKKFKQTCDELMIGDSDKAIELIKEFEAL